MNLLKHNLLLGAMPSWRRHSTSEHTSQTADLLVVCLPQVRTEHLAHAERIGVFSLSVSAKDGCHRFVARRDCGLVSLCMPLDRAPLRVELVLKALDMAL